MQLEAKLTAHDAGFRAPQTAGQIHELELRFLCTNFILTDFKIEKKKISKAIGNDGSWW